ncbi:MAG: SDR family oxidoreductase [Acidobacteria bacterium]|nr:SDR family oxidoreductase [Acidobacteriota bacterium]
MFQENCLKGQKGLITGGSSGIGLEIARVLIAHGAELTITGRDTSKLAHAKSELGDVLTVAGDVRQADDVAQTVDAHMARFGQVDFLINNAAGNFLCPIEAMSENAFRSVMEIVAHGTFLFSKAVFPHMKKRGYGRIINTGATYAWGQASYVAHSGAAKAAVLNLTRSMAVEWGHYGILVNMIAPGPIDQTEGMKRLMADPKKTDMLLNMMPVPRMGKGSEIGLAALFLIHPLSSYITGIALPVDGGMSLITPGLIPPGFGPKA